MKKKNKRDVFQFFHENRNSIPIFSKHLNPLSEFFPCNYGNTFIWFKWKYKKIRTGPYTMYWHPTKLSVSCLPLDEGPTGPTAGFCLPGGRFLRWKSSDTDEKSSNWWGLLVLSVKFSHWFQLCLLKCTSICTYALHLCFCV